MNVNLYKVNPDGSTFKSTDLEQVRRIIDQNNLNQVNYADTDMFERVRDECGEYLKSLEASQLEAGCIDLTKRIETDTVIDSIKVHDTLSVNSKRALDNHSADSQSRTTMKAFKEVTL